MAQAQEWPSLVSRNTFWGGLHLSQKKKATRNLGLWRAVVLALNTGYPLTRVQRAYYADLHALLVLMDKASHMTTWDEAVSARREFRRLWPDLRHLFTARCGVNETFVVSAPGHDVHAPKGARLAGDREPV